MLVNCIYVRIYHNKQYHNICVYMDNHYEYHILLLTLIVVSLYSGYIILLSIINNLLVLINYN